MSLKAQLSLAWVFGLAGLMMSGVADGWIALGIVAGVLMLSASVRTLRDEAAWDRFRHAQRLGRFMYPGGRVPQLIFAVALLIAGGAWTIGCVIALRA